MRFWLGVASADHARAGRDGGFAQLGHGKHIALAGVRQGDWLVYYSPRTELNGGESVKAFTTIGRVTSQAPYLFPQAMDFNPYRVDVDYLKHALAAPIRPLLPRLRLTRDLGSHWGMALRGPKRELDHGDMLLIAEAMSALQEFKSSGGNE